MLYFALYLKSELAPLGSLAYVESALKFWGNSVVKVNQGSQWSLRSPVLQIGHK